MGKKKGDGKGIPKLPNPAINEPYIICRHPEHGVMRYKNGWLQKIPQELKFKIESVISYSEGDPVLVNEDVEIDREIPFTKKMRISGKRKQRKRSCPPSHEKRKLQCDHCPKRDFPKRMSDFRGMNVCDECMRRIYCKDDYEKIRNSHINNPAIMQTNFNTIGM